MEDVYFFGFDFLLDGLVDEGGRLLLAPEILPGFQIVQRVFGVIQDLLARSIRITQSCMSYGTGYIVERFYLDPPPAPLSHYPVIPLSRYPVKITALSPCYL